MSPNRPVIRGRAGDLDVWREASGPGVSETYYARVDRNLQLRVGEPLMDKDAWRRLVNQAIVLDPGGSIASSPYPAPVTYQPIPAFSLSTGSVNIKGGAFRSTVEGPAFDMSGGYAKPHTLTIQDSIIRSNGPAFSGYRGRLSLKNVVLIIDRPTVKGKAPPRAIIMQEFADWQMENVTIIGGMGLTGTGLNNKFYGNPANGDGLRWKGIRYHNIDGRRSDGAGGYIKSNWANGHANNPDRIANGGEIGWDIANLVQLNGVNGLPMSITWSEVLIALGAGRTEDTISMYGGSGGSAAYPALIEDCLLDSSGGWDWNYIPGVSTTYDSSNQVTTGATSYQKVADTRSSGTSVIIGDGARTAYDDNSSYVTLRRVIGIGARPLIGCDYAHHITFDKCQTYLMPRHWSGVDYVNYHDGFFQIRPKTATATYPGGTRQIFGAITFTNNIYGTPTTGANETYELNASQMAEGGIQLGNIKVKSPDDGGAQIIRDFRNRAVAQGVQIGAYLSHPTGTIADAFLNR